jgi:hypothetical protein
MDSISGYESASKQGGAAGEVIIRKSLEKIFKELNVVLDVKTTDKGTILGLSLTTYIVSYQTLRLIPRHVKIPKIVSHLLFWFFIF